MNTSELKPFAVLFLTTLMSLNASASSMWVTTATLSSQDHLEKVTEDARSKIKGMDLDSIFDAELRSPVPDDKLARLFEMENKARTHALSGDFMKALQLYLDLLNQLKKIPNVSGLEKITFSTLLHLAELKSLLRAPDAAAVLHQAHAWAQGTKPSSTEFSPAMINRFAQLKIPRSGIVAIKVPEESMVFLDGRRLQSQELDGETYRVHVEPGWHQVSTLIGGSPWIFRNVEVQKSELVAVTMNPRSMITGDCFKPQYAGTPLPRQVRLLVDFGDQCKRILYKNNWYQVSGLRLDEANSKGAVSTAPTPQPESTVTETPLTLPTLPAARKKDFWSSTLRSGWFWTGVGVLAAGVAYAVTQNQNQTTIVIPSHVSQ